MAQPNASGIPRAVIVGDGDVFEVDGRRFRLDVKHDQGMDAPWKEHDGHGVVSDWTRRQKLPRERVLNQDRGSYRYYDMQASMQIALKDGWDAEPYKTGTKHEQAARAVERDFERLRAWCSDEWSWVYIKVTLLDGRDAGEFETLGGIESDSEEYISECAHELAGELLHRVVTLGGQV